MRSCRAAPQKCGDRAGYADRVSPVPTADPAEQDAPSAPGPHRTPTQRVWARVAAAVSGLQGLALVGFIGFYLYEIALGASDDVTRAVMSCVLFGVFAVGLLALARGWLRDGAWPRTPTMVWNLLLLPVAWSLRDADQLLAAALLGSAAVLGLVAAVVAGSPPEGPEQDAHA